MSERPQIATILYSTTPRRQKQSKKKKLVMILAIQWGLEAKG